jgi:hypothetical protein
MVKVASDKFLSLVWQIVKQCRPNCESVGILLVDCDGEEMKV